MDEREWLARRFEANRTHLRAVAYRMLGSVSEADDAVQDAWLRLARSDAGEVENLTAWLTTVTARVCLDMLRARRSRREEPLGPHVPEPIVGPDDDVDPEHEALLADSVGLALQVVLDTLTPAERLARLARFARPVLVNGAAGFVVAQRGRPVSVAGFTVAHGQIVEIDLLADPARLRELDLSALDS